MADNWTDDEIKTVAEERVAERKKTAIPKFVDIRDLAREKLQANPADPDAEAALEILQKGLQAFLQEHGATNGTTRSPAMLGNTPTEPEEDVKYTPECKPHKGDMIVPIYDENGKTRERHFESQLKHEGYIPVMEDGPDGEKYLAGYKKPGPNNSPAQQDQQAETVPVHSKDNVVTARKVTIAEGDADPNLEAVHGTDGKVTHYKELPPEKNLLGRPRRTHR